MNIEKRKLQKNCHFGHAVLFGKLLIAMLVKGRFQPLCEEPTKSEEQLMKLAKKLAALQRQWIKDTVGANVSVTFLCNLLHVMAGFYSSGHAVCLPLRQDRV